MKDDTPMNILDPEIYGDYNLMSFTKKGIDLKNWLENVTTRYEKMRIQNFGKIDIDFNEISKAKVKKLLKTKSELKYYQIGHADNRLNESKSDLEVLPKVKDSRRSYSLDRNRIHA